MSLESQIDDLYGLPPGEFTAARNALAKTLTGDDAKRVKALVKPPVLPWAINHLYWHARPAYDRLMKSGDALRAAQIAALEGRSGPLARAAEAHRSALAAASGEAAALAARHGVRPGADDLARMLEALSLAASRLHPPGRLTELLQPAGFEALAGVTPVDQRLPAAPRADSKRGENAAEAAARAAAKAAADARRRELERRVGAAEEELERAKTEEADARRALTRAEQARQRAEATLQELRRL